MFKSKKRIIFLIISLLIVSLVVLLTTPLTKVTANQEGSAISYQTPLNPTFSLAAYTQEGNSASESIANNQYVLLKKDLSFNVENYNKICFDIQSDKTRTTKRIIRLNINAYLNGDAINVQVNNQLSPELQGNSTESFVNFEISRHTDITYQNKFNEDNTQKSVEDLQGHYEFYFSVSLYDIATGVTTTEPFNYNWYKYEFTVIDEDQYSKAGQFPTLQNVTDNGEITNTTYKNNYIYDNSINYAQITFDAERYKLIITRVFEGKSEKIETRFAYFENNYFENSTLDKTNYARVYFDFKDKTVSFNLTRTSTSLPFIFDESNFDYNSSMATNYTMPLLYDLGEYSIKPYYQVYQTGSILYDSSTNSPVDIPAINLTVYGFNLNYAYNLTDTKYFMNFKSSGNLSQKQATTTTTDFSTLGDTQIGSISIPSTNQAPVWFNTQAGAVDSIKYFHAQSKDGFFSDTTTINDIKYDTTKTWSAINKNYYFTLSGYYAVVCRYGFSTLTGASEYKVFLFQIKANTPTVTLKIVGNNNKDLVSGGYTNQNVYVELTKEGEFDSIVKAQYALNTNFSSTFTNYTEFTAKKGADNTYTIFTTPGKYSIKVMFGKQSSSYYTFTIDKTDIKEYVNAYLVKAQRLSASETKYVTSSKVTSSTILNNNFTLVIQEKPSKAKIQAKLITVDIQSYEPNQTAVYTTNDNQEYINARYRATYASSPNEYNNIVSSALSYVESKYVFKEHKIYIFEISDEAGFSYVHITYLDKASANVLEYDANNQQIETTEYNIVSSKTSVVWAQNKGIEFIDKNALGHDSEAVKRNNYAMSVLANSEYFKNNGTTFVLLIPIVEAQITSTNLDGTITPNVSGDLYASYKNSGSITLYGLLEEAIHDSAPETQRYILSGEKIYTISIKDESGIVTTYHIEVNMDKSLGKAYTLNADNLVYNTTSRLNLQKAGSLDYLVFEWKDDVVDSPYAIQSLTYAFYPLTYSINDSQSFPYSSTATKTGNLLTDSSFDDASGLYRSNPINTTHIKYYDSSSGTIEQKQKIATEAGKYVITRTYAGSANIEEITSAGDTLVKEYVFYVDRNPIVDYPQSDIIPDSSTFKLGGGVKLLFGDENKEFNQFYRENINSIDVIYSEQTTTTKIYLTLESNLLPIKVKIPQNKYSIANNSMLTTYANTPTTFTLVATLMKFDNLGNQVFSKTYNENYLLNRQVDAQGYLVIDDITSDGYYLLQIRDNSVTPNNQLSPSINTSTYFAFYVNLSGPEAAIASSNERAIIAGDQPLTMSISGNYYQYTVSSSVRSFTYSYRDLDISNPNLTTAFGSSYQGNLNNARYPIYTSNSKLRQYRFEVTYNDASLPNTIHYSPLYSDYNNYVTLPNGSATKDNYVILKFDEPSEDYMASIDYSDISIVRFEKVNGLYATRGTRLVMNTDYVLQQRLNPSTGKITYSIEVFAVDDNSPSKEYRYDITYHFVGAKENYQTIVNNQTVSYYSNTQSFYVDKTAPTYNLNILAKQTNNTRILSQQNKQAYTASYYKDNNDTYFYANTSDFDFAIDANFIFTRPRTAQGAIDTQEGSTIYVRKYHKYDEDYYPLDAKNQAYQAIVPGDPDYVSGTSARLRFNAQDSSLWKNFNYDGSTSFIAQMRNLYPSETSVEGYYEIVEIDAVGNYSIYTVVYMPSTPTFTFSYNTLTAFNIQQAFPYSENGESKKLVSSYNYVTLLGINSIDAWYTITVDNSYKTIYVTPATNMANVLEEINTAINRGNDLYTLTISNRFGDNVTVQIAINTSYDTFKVSSSNRSNDDGYYAVNFEEDRGGLIMSSVKVYRFNTETKTFESFVNDVSEFIDVYGTVLSVKKMIDETNVNPNYSRTYYYEEGIYKFYIEDNFNFGENATIITLNVGNNVTNYSIEYSAPRVIYRNQIYTTDNVTVNANIERYTTFITRNGASVSTTGNSTILEAPALSIEANIQSGDSYKYIVTILDNVTGEEYVEQFIIYNIFPAVTAKNARGENMDKLLATSKNSVSSFTAESVYLSYPSTGYAFGYSFSLRRYDNLNSETYTTVTTGLSGTTVYAKGAYELVIKNNILNSTRSIYFVIRESTLSMYSVAERLPNGTLNTLTPSQDLLDISSYRTIIQTYLRNHDKDYTFGASLNIKNYFSIYDFEVTVDGDKSLSTNWGKSTETIVYNQSSSGTNQTYIVLVYGSSPYNYLDVFALTKITANSRFVESISYSYTEDVTNEETGEKVSSLVTIDVPTTTFDNVTIYASPATITWQSYFNTILNKVYLSYTYNDKFIGIIEPSSEEQTSLILNDDGEYRIRLYDLAGNYMLFGEGMYSEFTINIKSSVVTKVNGKAPIYGAVYNNNVEFTVENPDNYTQLNVEVYINGVLQKSTKITKSSPTITFDQTGFYKLIIKGATRTSTANVKNLATKEVVFTIINPNESKFAYEFASISGYEITKVLRNGFDITSELSPDNSGIYSLVLSDDFNGIGKYNITVKAEFINSLREPEEFSFDVWINNKTPTLNVNTKRNETSVNTIVITYNPKALYEQLGDCKIVIGNQEFAIDASSLVNDKNTTLTIDTAGTYYIKLVTKSGNVVSIYKVIKQDPLNVLSIILIILGIGVAIAGIYLFYRLRVKMKIK